MNVVTQWKQKAKEIYIDILKRDDRKRDILFLPEWHLRHSGDAVMAQEFLEKGYELDVPNKVPSVMVYKYNDIRIPQLFSRFNFIILTAEKVSKYFKDVNPQDDQEIGFIGKINWRVIDSNTSNFDEIFSRPFDGNNVVSTCITISYNDHIEYILENKWKLIEYFETKHAWIENPTGEKIYAFRDTDSRRYKLMKTLWGAYPSIVMEQDLFEQVYPEINYKEYLEKGKVGKLHKDKIYIPLKQFQKQLNSKDIKVFALRYTSKMRSLIFPQS